MIEKSPIRALLDSWPTRQALADEIGVNVASVHKWAGTSRIPSNRHAAVVRAAQAAGLDHITYEWMAIQHALEDGGDAA